MKHFSVILLWSTVHLVAAAPASDDGKGSGQPGGPRPTASPATGLRVALSDDGLQFVETGEVFLHGAFSPSMVRLPNGELLAVFQYCDPASKDKRVALWASRSKDDGKTWVRPQPIRLRDLPENVTIADPDLVVMPSGLVRMYFSVYQPPDRSRARPAVLVLSAVTRDGLEYQLDYQTRIACPNMQSGRPIAFWADKQMVLMVAGQSAPAHVRPDQRTNTVGPSERWLTQQYVSRDGRKFTSTDRVRAAGQIGHVVQLDARHWRMYVSSDNEVHAYLSDDGLRWRHEPGVCLSNAFNPTVAVLANGKYLMLFCTLTDKPYSGEQLVGAAQPERAQADNSKGAPATGSNPPGAGDADKSVSATDSAAGWDAFGSGGVDTELGSDQNTSGPDYAPLAQSDNDFAPKPDLRNRFDYTSWYEQNVLLPYDQTSFETYAVLLDKTLAEVHPESRSLSFKEGFDWDAVFMDMFNTRKVQGAPSPWYPADHPDWEKGLELSQPYIEMFRTAAEDPRSYGMPLLFSSNVSPEDHLLSHASLPGLSLGSKLTRAMMAGAWRTEDGQVSPERMREVWKTCLGNAQHLEGDQFLIDQMVGLKDRYFVEENARWALQQNVFSTADEIEAAWSVLQENDVGSPDLARSLLSEHACIMEMIQEVFRPATPGGEPKVNMERAKHLLGGRTDRQAWETALASATVEDAKAAIDAIDGYYRAIEPMLRTGYPSVRRADIDQVAEKWKAANPSASAAIVSYGGVHQLSTWGETARRATQLSFAVQLFKAQTGRWPDSLNELPTGKNPQIRIDPFSGSDFGYQIDKNGPRIYSVGEDTAVGPKDDLTDRVAKSLSLSMPSGSNYTFWPPRK